MIYLRRLGLLIIIAMPFFNCFAQSYKCRGVYNVKLTLLPQTDSIDLADLYWPTANQITGLSKSDTLFTLVIQNKGCESVSVPQVASITYKDERSGYESDLFFHLWYRNREGKYIVFKSKSADIYFIEDPTQASAENTLAPGKKRRINRRMNPFHIHGDRGPGHYRLQAFYRFVTPQGDYITKSNFAYIKITNYKPVRKSIQEEN